MKGLHKMSSINEIAQSDKAATYEFLATIKTHSESDLDKSAYGWSPRQVINHLADSEAQSYSRLRRLLAEPGTTIQGYDESRWVESTTLGYESQGIQDSLAVFTAVRKSSYELIKRLTESQLDNTGTHTESGTYTAQNWLKSYTNHPINHANQIRQQKAKP